MDMLKDALHPLPCKWAGCSATLASWRRLYQHYRKVHLSSKPHEGYECHMKENQCGRLCNTGFETYEGLWEHIKVNHLNKLLYQCPFNACNMNLKRLDNNLHDIQSHLDEHHQFGEDIVLARSRELPCPHPTPPPRGEQLSYQLIAQLFNHPSSSPRDILAARKKVVHNPYEHESHLFGSLLTDEQLEEEESTGAAMNKERRIRLTGPLGKQQPSRKVPRLEAPPLPLFRHASRHLITSVGFDSTGFHQKAQLAFQKAEEDVDMDMGDG